VNLYSLRTIPLPLPNKKPQSKIIRLKHNLTPLRKEKHIPLLSLHFLARLVADVEVAVDNNLDLVVGVGVFERCAFLEAVETAGDGLVGV
jgi:hypothetical protein